MEERFCSIYTLNQVEILTSVSAAYLSVASEGPVVEVRQTPFLFAY
jgi:hypothetical protein